jgi:hypothetical protein
LCGSTERGKKDEDREQQKPFEHASFSPGNIECIEFLTQSTLQLNHDVVTDANPRLAHVWRCGIRRVARVDFHAETLYRESIDDMLMLMEQLAQISK